MKRRLEIHPFFIVAILQMLRHDETDKATRLVANELLIFFEEMRPASTADDSAGDEGMAGDGGLLLLPTLRRQQKLGCDVGLDVTIETLEKEYEDERIHEQFEPR